MYTTTKSYKASDGTLFEDEEVCLVHELRLLFGRAPGVAQHGTAVADLTSFVVEHADRLGNLIMTLKRIRPTAG